MRRWSSTVGGGFICRKAGWIQERRVDDETDNLHGDGGICGGMAMGATRLVPRLLILESASVGEKIWIYRTPEQGSIVKGESRGDYPEGGTAWTFRVYLWMEQEQEGITLRFDGEQVVGCRVGYYGTGMELYALGTPNSYCSMADGIYKVSDPRSALDRASERFPNGATLNWKFLVFWEYEETAE